MQCSFLTLIREVFTSSGDIQSFDSISIQYLGN